MELLTRLLGGAERVKIMRFFLHHEDNTASISEVSEKTKSKSSLARRELNSLVTLGFLEKRKMRIVTRGTKKSKSKVKDVTGYKLNRSFPHNQALKDLLFDFESLDKRELASRFKSVGRIKLFIVSGVFIGEEKSRVDILIVGEAINKPKVDKLLKVLSAELGREVIYSVMDVEEYDYRFKMYDKFVRDIVDMPHERVVDRLTDNRQQTTDRRQEIMNTKR